MNAGTLYGAMTMKQTDEKRKNKYDGNENVAADVCDDGTTEQNTGTTELQTRTGSQPRRYFARTVRRN